MRVHRAAILLCASLAGCASHEPIARCAWPPEARAALDLGVRAARRHLHEDALRAEDIGIRYADARNAPHSGHFMGFAAYKRTTDSCVTAMLGAVARTHGVSPDSVRASLARRPVGGDVLVNLSFAALFALIAYGVTGRLNQSFPLDGGRDSVVAVAAIVMTSMLASGVAVLVGEWYAISIEVFRVGNGHLSDRVQRVPWTHHRVEYFLTGVVLFWLVAALRHRIGFGHQAGRATSWAADAARGSRHRRAPVARP